MFDTALRARALPAGARQRDFAAAHTAEAVAAAPVLQRARLREHTRIERRPQRRGAAQVDTTRRIERGQRAFQREPRRVMRVEAEEHRGAYTAGTLADVVPGDGE